MGSRFVAPLLIVVAVIATAAAALRPRTQPARRKAELAAAFDKKLCTSAKAFADATPAVLVPDPFIRWEKSTPEDAAYDTALANLLAAQRALWQAEERWYATGSVADRTAMDNAREQVRSAETVVDTARTRRDLVFGPVAGAPGYRGIPIERNAVLVRFRDRFAAREIGQFLEARHLEVRSVLPASGVFVVQLPEIDSDPEKRFTTYEGDATRVRAVADLLSEHDFVIAVQNSVLGLHLLPRDPLTQTSPLQRNWFSGVEPLATSKFPESWNFNAAITARTRVGVLDLGFRKRCPNSKCDLEATNVCTEFRDKHGTKMASILGAGFNDRLGMDGASPFADLLTCGVGKPVKFDEKVPKSTILDRQEALFDRFLCGLELLVDPEGANARVVNASVGYNWGNHHIPTSDPDLQALVTKQGESVRSVMAGVPKTILVASAGNDSNRAAGRIEPAEWASPFNWAALGTSGTSSPSGNVLVVEALAVNGRDPKNDSNGGGSIAAIGENVFSMEMPGTYAISDGTSPATPLVAATIATMLAADDTLDAAKIKTALGIGTGSGRPKLCAFTAVKAVVRRADFELVNLAGPFDSVNEYDFLAFRDAYQQIRDQRITEDLNGDGNIDANDVKFCRVDFDGNGRVEPRDLDVMIRAWSTALSQGEIDELRRRLEQRQ